MEDISSLCCGDIYCSIIQIRAFVQSMLAISWGFWDNIFGKLKIVIASYAIPPHSMHNDRHTVLYICKTVKVRNDYIPLVYIVYLTIKVDKYFPENCY